MVLTPGALAMILQCDDLPVDEMTLFQMTVDWAELYYLREGRQYSQISRSKSATRSTVTPHNLSRLNQLYPRSGMRGSGSLIMNKSARKPRVKAMKAVSEVMSMIRYALLTPDQLREIEEKDEYRELIPVSYIHSCIP